MPLQAAFSFCIRCKAQEGLEGSKKWDTEMPAVPHLTSNHLLSCPSACMHSFTLCSPKKHDTGCIIKCAFSESTLLAMCKQMGWGARRGTGRTEACHFSRCIAMWMRQIILSTQHEGCRRIIIHTYTLFFRAFKTWMCWSFCFRRQEADTQIRQELLR